MINTLNLILQSPIGLLDEDDAVNRIGQVAEAIDLALRNIKFGDDIQEYLNNKDTPQQCKALVEVITNFIEVEHKNLPSVPPPPPEVVKPLYPITKYIMAKVTKELNDQKVEINIRRPANTTIANKIGAIKSIRTMSDILLIDAKHIVDSSSIDNDWHIVPGTQIINQNDIGKLYDFVDSMSDYGYQVALKQI